MPVEESGYSGTPLYKKLGIKDGMQCVFRNLPDHYSNLFDHFPDVEVIEAETAKNSIDFIHLFTTHRDELNKEWAEISPLLAKSGIFWVSWPKNSSKLEKDLDGNIVREFGLKKGLVDVKVCAVDKDWSGLKFMYRKSDR